MTTALTTHERHPDDESAFRTRQEVRRDRRVRGTYAFFFPLLALFFAV
jgi:hypothetical protein